MTDEKPAPIQHSKHLTEIAPDTFIDADGHQLTASEVRNIVTPHDFAVAPALFGLKLARPWRRGLAMALDGLLIVMLASGSMVVILPLAAYLAWRCHKHQTPRRRNIILLILPLLFFVSPFNVNYGDNNSSTDLSSAILLGASAIKLNSTDCDLSCAEQISDNLITELSIPTLSDQQAERTFAELLENSPLSAQQQQDKLNQLKQRRAKLTPVLAPDADQELNFWQRLAQSDNSVIKWLKGILADLGISLGWAVAYFTLFISWNNGQTPAKSLLRIKVVQLNNQPLTLWQAFGRQGGYSAGVATGLLGFLQIYWDPNRQAIQDKVADTLVLQL